MYASMKNFTSTGEHTAELFAASVARFARRLAQSERAETSYRIRSRLDQKHVKIYSGLLSDFRLPKIESTVREK